MKNKNIKYLRGTIINVELESDIFSNLLILNDVFDDSKEIICIKIDVNTKKTNNNIIITIPNGEYNKLNYYIHNTVVDSVIQEIREKNYAYDEESIAGREKLIKSLGYINYR